MRKKETPRAVIDSAKAKLIAYGIVAVFIGVMAVIGVRSVSGPQLYEGDRLETRTCRRCQGTGLEPDTRERCKGCLGAKQVKVIVPGPENPVTVAGTVRDLSAFKDEEEAAAAALADAHSGDLSLKPVKGAVRGASLEFQAPWGQIHVESKATGRYRCKLKPGEYTVKAGAPGYQGKQQSLTVPARKSPIWPRMPGLTQEDEDAVQFEIVLSP